MLLLGRTLSHRKNSILSCLLEHRLVFSTQLSSLALSPAPPTANIATTVGRNTSGRVGGSSSPNRGRGRGRGHGSGSPHLAASNNTSRLQGRAPSTAFSPSSRRPFCQLCKKTGHTAFKCYHLNDEHFQPDRSPTLHAAQVDHASSVRSVAPCIPHKNLFFVNGHYQEVD